MDEYYFVVCGLVVSCTCCRPLECRDNGTSIFGWHVWFPFLFGPEHWLGWRLLDNGVFEKLSKYLFFSRQNSAISFYFIGVAIFVMTRARAQHQFVTPNKPHDIQTKAILIDCSCHSQNDARHPFPLIASIPFYHHTHIIIDTLIVQHGRRHKRICL